MKLTLILATIAVSQITMAKDFKDPNTPRIEEVAGQTHLHIPESAKESLKKWDKDFTVLKKTAFTPRAQAVAHENASLPYGTVGDYNGDGFEDLAVLGSSKDRVKVVFLLAKGAAWDVKPIESFKEDDFDLSSLDLYLLNLEPPKGKKLKNHTDFKGKAAVLELFGGMSKAFFVKADKVIEHSGELVR